MLWYALILAIVVGSLVGLFTRNLGKALKIAFLTFLGGIVLSLLIILSGVLGG
jgi:Na+/H+-dicarboxylate symporter